MSQYQHVLVGLDFTPEESQVVISKAKALAQSCGAKLSLAHVIEPLALAYAGEIPIDITTTQANIEKYAKKQLEQLAIEYQIPPESVHLLLGSTAIELRETAEKINADLIIVGSHGRHGLALIFGSTASDVIHGAQCDVLAVRV